MTVDAWYKDFLSLSIGKRFAPIFSNKRDKPSVAAISPSIAQAVPAKDCSDDLGLAKLCTGCNEATLTPISSAFVKIVDDVAPLQ